MTEEIPLTLLLACMAIFTTLTVWNLRRYVKYKTSPIAPLLSLLILLLLILLYLNETSYAFVVFALIVLIAIVALPNAWKDWVKVLRQEGVNPKEGIKLRDYLSWKLFIKLGYRFGVKRASFLYALNYSVIFVVGYCIFGTLLSVRYCCEIALIVAIVILPINYRLARKTIEEFSLKGEGVENEKY